MDKTPQNDGFDDGEELAPEEEDFQALMGGLNEAVSKGDADKAEELLPQFWEALAGQMDSEPDPVLDAYNLAHEKEWAGDWVGAEAAYREILRIALEGDWSVQTRNI